MFAAVLGVASACGGNANEVVGGTAGATSAAGSSSLAGASTAGAPGAAGEACTAVRDSGSCEAYIPSFWHDPSTGLCEPFVYGGCGGNANRYPSREACLQACPNVSDDWDKCASDDDCTFVSPNCCGECEPVAIERLTAINGAHQTAYEKAHCLFTLPCAPCEPVIENMQSEKYFKPACRNAHCTVIDIRETALTACEKTSDCMLRDGADCCAQCDGTGWVAVNQNADLCGGAPTPCDDCASQPPSEWDVVCLSGRCFQEGPL